ncbi:MAG: hypothetical protein EXQ55_01520 [Acidobacteria bacterium]|nr:hypothetical protein [Acidobacteriota bacterium]
MKKIFAKEQSGGDQIVLLVLAIILCATALWAVGCGGGGSGSTPTTPSTTSGSTGTIGATVTINASGLSDSTPRIKLGERVRFINADTKAHQILTTPHLLHTDCPGLNNIGSLAPGQSGTSDALSSTRGCGFHDHFDPDNNSFRGQVLVGLSSSDPVPPDPNYVR